MNYEEVKSQLEATKRDLENRIQNTNLSDEEKAELKRAIGNYEYIIELTDMNHFERGAVK